MVLVGLLVLVCIGGPGFFALLVIIELGLLIPICVGLAVFLTAIGGLVLIFERTIPRGILLKFFAGRLLINYVMPLVMIGGCLILFGWIFVIAAMDQGISPHVPSPLSYWPDALMLWLCYGYIVSFFWPDTLAEIRDDIRREQQREEKR